MSDIPNPPRFAQRFFRWFCHRNHLEGLEGDLYEEFASRVRELGPVKARRAFVADMFTLVRPSVARSLGDFLRINPMTMAIFANYFRTTIRLGIKRKWFTVINLVGLTLGITSVIFISLFISDELSYDQHISDAHLKYRIYDIRYGDDGEINYLPIVPPVFAPYLKENYEQVDKAGRLIFDYGGTTFYIEDQAYAEKNGLFAEKEALEILDLTLLKGSIDRMNEPNSLLLSESTFTKFFGDVPFENQFVKLTTLELQVVGIFEDLPEQSHLDLDYVYPFELATQNITEERMNQWNWQQFYTYVQLRPGTDIPAFEDEMQKDILAQSEEHTKEYGFYYVPNLQPIRDIHLHSSGFEWDIAKAGNYQSIVFLSIAAGIILLIACLNFINLTTALALRRAREVCVRKFVGARRSQLVVQHTLEATSYTMISGIFSLFLVVLFLPFFNAFTGKSFELGSLITLTNAGIYVAGLISVGLISGFYPALLITSFKPLQSLRGLDATKVGAKSGFAFNIRQVMVGAQYVLSIGLILVSLIIQKQYRFLQSTDMGFNSENLVAIQLTKDLKKDFESTRTVFSNHSAIRGLSFAYGTPAGIVAGDGVNLPERDEAEFASNMFMIDANYLTTMGIRLVAGRDFSHEVVTDESTGFIINETAVRNFGLGTPEQALGEPVHWQMWSNSDSTKIGRVIGVVEDFNFKSLHNEMSSTVLHMGPEYYQVMMIRLAKGSPQEAIGHLERAYRQFEPTRPFEFEFIDESFRRYYQSEQKLSVLFSIFTGLAILTAGIGLFGLVSFNLVSRAREISIRKVLGAEVATVFQLLVRRYFVMAVLCMFIAAPAAFYLGGLWLSNFAYQVELDVWLFIQVGFITLLLTIVTVGYQTLRGAMANPADKLRSE